MVGEYLCQWWKLLFSHYVHGDSIAGVAFEHIQCEYPLRPLRKKLVMKLVFSNK